MIMYGALITWLSLNCLHALLTYYVNKPQSRFARFRLELQCKKARSRRAHPLRKPPLDAQLRGVQRPPNLSRRRLDVCHTSTHGVALVLIQDAGLKRAARGSLQIQDAKKVAKNRHLGTIAQICWAISWQLSTPLPSNRHHLRCGDRLEGKGENYQVCSVQYCVQQLCTVRCTHI